MKKYSIFCIALFAFSTNAFAIFCPTGFSEINPGDTLEQVQKACGKPDSQKKYKAEVDTPQEWNYYITMNQGDQGTIKMTIAFDHNQVINMSVNGAGVTETAICGNDINNGNTPQQIEAACGKPSFINKSNVPSNAPPAAEITELTYNGTPPVTLLFENGKFKNRK